MKHVPNSLLARSACASTRERTAVNSNKIERSAYVRWNRRFHPRPILAETVAHIFNPFPFHIKHTQSNVRCIVNALDMNLVAANSIDQNILNDNNNIWASCCMFVSSLLPSPNIAHIHMLKRTLTAGCDLWQCVRMDASERMLVSVCVYFIYIMLVDAKSR